MANQPIISSIGDAQSRHDIALLGADTAGQLSFRVGDTMPGDGPPLHMHLEQAETFHVIRGEFMFQVGEEVVTAGPGTTAYVPKQTPHSFRCVSQEPGQMISVLTPGIHDEFIQTVPEAQSDGLPKDEIKAMSLAYGTEILGPATALENAISK